MRKYILLVVSAVALAFTSCSDKEEIGINYQVNITISPETVISGFQEYRDGNLKLGSNCKLRIRNYIYDVNNDLVKLSEGFVNQYSDNLQVSEILPEGDYTVITTTDVIVSNVADTSWTFSKERVLNEFTITRNNNLCFLGRSTLGLTKSSLKVNGQSVNLKINVKPITALITCHFQNIHHPINKVLAPVEIDLIYKNTMDIVKYQGEEWEISTSAAETDLFRLDYLDLTNSYYDNLNNIYNLVAVLPSNTTFMGYVESVDDEGNRYGKVTDGSPVDIKMGKQYDFIFDLATFTLVTESKTKSMNTALQHSQFGIGNSIKSYKAVELLN